MIANNSTTTNWFGLSLQSYNGLLFGSCLFSTLTTIVNTTLLIATKYASAGRSPTMAFMRCLCLSDLMIGLFGIFKSLLLIYTDNRQMNCFLPESLLVTGSTTLCLLLFWLNLDSYLRLMHPLHYGQRMDKQNIVTGLMVVWNVTFVIGFLPQMGWSNELFECNVFKYYSHGYVSFVSFLWTVGVLGSCLLQILLRRKILQVQKSHNYIFSSSAEFEKYAYMVNVIGTDVLLWTVCYLPFMIYMQVIFFTQSYKHSDTPNENLVFFIPAFLLRAFISAFIHSYRTIRLQRVFLEIKQQLTKTRSSTGDMSHQDLSKTSSVNTETISVTQDQVPVGSSTNISCITRSHRKLKATESVITMVVEDDEPRQLPKAVTKF